MAASSPSTDPVPVRDEINFIADVARVCGEDVANLITETFGGTLIYVAANPLPQHLLATVVGLEIAQRIASQVGFGTIPIPLGDSGELARRRERIEHLVLAGVSVRMVCRKVRCSDRTVYNVRKRLRDSGRLT